MAKAQLPSGGLDGGAGEASSEGLAFVRQVPNTRAILGPTRQTMMEATMSTSTKTSTTTEPTLSRDEAERKSIGKVKGGQQVFRLYGGKLRYWGTLVAIRPAGSGYDLVFQGSSSSRYAGAATMVYLAKEKPSHTEAFEALHAERQAARVAEAQAQAEARALADSERLAAKKAATDEADASGRSAKAMAPTTDSTKQDSTPVEAQVDLHKELVALLKKEGVKVTPKWSPSKKYAAYKLASGKTIGYVFAQTRSGIKVKAGVTLKELGSAKKGWVDNSKEAPFSARGFFTLDTLDKAVHALKLTAERQAEAGKEKAASPAKGAADAKTSAPRQRGRATTASEVKLAIAEAIQDAPLAPEAPVVAEEPQS